jgi:phosphate transport system protein
MVEPSEGHTVKRYDAELTHVRSMVIEMGGLALAQIDNVVMALSREDLKGAASVIDRDHVLDKLELQADEAIVHLIVRRQPVANDLRMVIASSKAIADLERIGDEVVKIAHLVMYIYGHDENLPSKTLLRDIKIMARLVKSMLRGSVDAFDRLDMENALNVIQNEIELNEEFQAAMRRLATYMLEDSRTLGHAINVVIILKALERIGDHAKNIAQYVVYQVNGKDIRHDPLLAKPNEAPREQE